MTDEEIRLKCVELALGMALPDRSAPTVVGIAQQVYTFVKAPATAEKPAQPEDKPKRGRPAKFVDPLS